MPSGYPSHVRQHPSMLLAHWTPLLGCAKSYVFHKLMSVENEHLELFLGPPNGWRRTAFAKIKEIPIGHLAAYGRIAELVRHEGHSTGARNIAWLRNKLYELLGHETKVPLHRVAKKGDVGSLADSDHTKYLNDSLRGEEGFFKNPRWV